MSDETLVTVLLSLPIAGLATARGTRLIVTDQITAPLRSAAWRIDPSMRHVGYLVSCPYCVGIWMALIVWLMLSLAYVQGGAAGWLIMTPVMVLAIAQLGMWLSKDEPTSTTMYVADEESWR